MRTLFKVALGLLLCLPVIAFAVNITVPSAPSNGYFLVSLLAGNYNATSTIFSQPNGNIGIGTTTAAQLLTLSASDPNTALTSAGLASLSIINSNTTANNTADLVFKTADTVGATVVGTKFATVFTSHTAAAVSADLVFLTRNLGTLSEKMRLTAQGFFGIGSTTPGTTLSVNGDSVIAGKETARVFTATSTLAASTFPYASTTALSVSGLTSGNCVQAGTGGLLVSASAACGSGSGSSGNVATSTSETQGFLAYWTSTAATPATLGKVATGTVSSGTGISVTAGQSIIGSGLTITNTSPLSGLVAAFPFAFTNPTLTWLGLSTSSPGITSGQPVYATGANTIASVASSTFLTSIGGQASGNYITALTGDVTATGPGSVAATLATVNGNVGSFTNTTLTVNGKGLITAASNGTTPEVPLSFTWPLIRTTNTISFGGLSTSTAAVVGNIPYFSGVNTFANVATTSASCGTGVSCTSFTVIGASPITITNTSVASAFPFTPFANYNATGTAIGFSGGIFSTASSTFNSNVYFTNLAQGLSYIGTNGLQATVSTSTLTASGPLTGSFTQVGSGGALGCTTASSGVAGCLSNTSFDTFNNKQAALTFTWPLINSANTVTFGGLSTSSAPSIGGLPYWTGVSTFGTVATTSETCTGPISCTAHAVLTGGGAISITQSGLTTDGYLSAANFQIFNNKVGTSSNATAGQLAMFTTTNGTPALISGVSTSSVTCSSGVSCGSTSFVLGGALAITNSGVTSNVAGTGISVSASTGTSIISQLSYIATSSAETGGQLAAWNTTSGTPAKLYSIATSTATCSTGITCSAFTVVGTVNPAFNIAANALTLSMFPQIAANTVIGNLTGSTGTPTAFATSSLFTGTAGQNAYFSGTGTLIGTSSLFTEISTGNIGIGTTSPTGPFAIARTSSAAAIIADGFNTIRALFNTASTTGSIFTVAATTTTNAALLAGTATKLFDVDQYGHLTASSTRATPTVSCTPSGGTISANSNDVTGDITGGTLSTACTVTFASVYAATPEVIVTPSATSQIVGVSARSTTSFTISFASGITGDTVSYFVIQP